MSDYFRLYGQDLNVEFYDRAPACPDCGAVYDSRWIGPLASKPKYDYSCTLDGALVVSSRFAEFGKEVGDVTALQLPGRDDVFVLVVDRRFTVDPVASNLDRVEYCLGCNAWRGIRRAPRLVVAELPPAGFSASDVCFGFQEMRQNLRRPAFIVDGATMARIEQERFTGIVAEPIEISTSAPPATD